MGDDFMQKTKKSFRRGCDRERRKLTLADFGLFGTSKNIRTVSCTPYSMDRFVEGQLYELTVERLCGDSAHDSRIFVHSDGVEIGVCTEPPKSVLNELLALGGKTLGAFYKVREHSGIVELAIALELESKAGEAA